MIKVPVQGKGFVEAHGIIWGFNLHKDKPAIPVIIVVDENGEQGVRIPIDESNAHLFPCEYAGKTEFIVGKHHQNEIWNGKEFVSKTEENCNKH